ncbi:uncharacterized protein LOC141640516 [Silene latifolia]|uniref:uncharacterized protein LOC141640516 n=1 Tax=Silene latifolia TaxID=37657 RepID=UPI003D772337
MIFENCVNFCGFDRCPTNGFLFTWNNKQEIESRRYSRLDRALINLEWSQSMPDVYAHFLPEGDIIESFFDIENSLWDCLEESGIYPNANCKKTGDVFGWRKSKLASLEYKELLDASNLFLSQKAKMTWIKDGDCNSKYFHGVIKSKFLRNQVLYIKNMKGDECDDPQSIQDAFLNYYKHLLGTEVETAPVNPLIIRRGKVCTENHRDILLKPVTKLEIKEAIFSIPKHKAHCPDGLTGVLPELVSMNQGGFIKGGSIIENILVCQDLVRLYNRQACTPRCMFKMDLMKAYDSISWQFVKEILDAFLFPPQFSNLVMECIRSATFSIAVNGEIFGFFPDECSKSNAYFNGVGNRLKDEITSVSGFKEGTLPFKYLGVPITAGRLKKRDCTVLIDKIVDRIRSLGAKKLSYAGRLVLVNSVLSTLYNYWAAMFILPKGVLDRVDAICRNFLWEGSTEYTKAPRVAWTNLHEENHTHLFHKCVYSSQILQGVGQWLCSNLTQSDVLLKIARSRWGRHRKSIGSAAAFNCWYAVWLQRNQARLNQCIVVPAVVIAQVQQAIRSHYCLYKSCKMSSKDRAWLIRVYLESN